MEKENLNITVNGDVKNPIVIELLEGEARKQQYPVKYSRSGTINAPYFFIKRIKDIKNAVVEYSIAEKYIKLLEDPNDSYGAEITGAIKLNPDLVAFGINKHKYFSGQDLMNHARSFAHCFQNTGEAKELIRSLQNFDVKFEQSYIKTDDRKGAKEDSIKSAITFNKGEVKTEITLFIPLFVGSPRVLFDVEIEIEAKEGKPVFGFYSINMEQLIKDEADKLILDQLELFQKADFVIIPIS